MFILLPLLLAIAVTAVNSQGLKWTKPLPKDYILVPGDQIRLPLDDYVSIEGAKITGVAPYADVTIQKIQQNKTIPILDPKIKTCTLSVALPGGVFIFLCDSSRVLAKVQIDIQLGTISKIWPVIDLVAGPTMNLLPSSQTCTDMVLHSSSLYVSCFDSGSTSSRIVIFKVSYADNLTIDLVNNCTQETEKTFRPLYKMSIFSMSDASFLILLHDPSMENNNLNAPFVTCSLTQSNNTAANAKFISIASNQQDGVIVKGHLRALLMKSNTELLYAVASTESQTKSIVFGLLNVAPNGDISKSAVTNAMWNMTSSLEFVPASLNIIMDSSSTQKVLYMADHSNFYTVNVTFNTSNITISNATTIPVNCGLSKTANIFASRILIEGTIEKGDAFRALVEYRTSGPSSLPLKEFAVLFGTKKYGCSRASGLVSGNFDNVNYINSEWVITLKERDVTLSKLNRNTYLNLLIKTSGSTAAPKKEVTLTASLEGNPDATTTLTFEAFDSIKDISRIAFTNPEVKAYSGSKFVLPIPSSNFLASAASYTSIPNSSHVKINNAKTHTLNLQITPPTDYFIHRIIAVDHDTYVAVLRSTKGEQEGFIRLWTVWKEDVLSISKNTSMVLLDATEKQVVFKIFKVGADHFCLILKSTRAGSDKKYAYTCYADNAESEVKNNNVKIDKLEEITDIQVNEGSSRTDLIFVNLKSENRITYLPFQIDGTKSISVGSVLDGLALPSNAEIQDYIPVDVMFDFWGDSESNSYITAKMVSKRDRMLQPIIAKFSLEFDLSTPVLKYIYSIPIDYPQVGYCSCKNEIILYNPRNRKIWAMRADQGQAGISTNKNIFYYPINDYNIVNILQFNCIPEKGVFQILGQDVDSNKYIVTYRGGESISAPRRVHSIEKVQKDSHFIESGFNFDYIVTVASVVGVASSTNDFVVVYPEGPIFTVDNTNSVANYDITIKAATGGKADAEGKIKIVIIAPKTFAVLTPITKFDIVPNKPIFLDDVAKIDGPVIDIKQATENPNVKLTKRMNKHKTYTLAESTTPDRIYVEKDFMVVQYGETKIKIYGDHAATKEASPKEILTISSSTNTNHQYKDVGLIGYGATSSAILVVKYYHSTNAEYMYDIYQLTKTETGFGFVASSQVFKTKIDYDSLQLTTFGDNEVILALRNKKSYISNFIRLYSFKKDTGNIFRQVATATILTNGVKEIGWYSLVSNNKNQAVIMSHYQGYAGFIAAVWDGMTNSKIFLAETQKTVKLSETENKHLLVNYLKCWSKEILTIECLIDTEGIVDFVLEFILEDTTNATVPEDYIKTINKLSEFIMPPQFEIKRTDRSGKYYGLLLRKTAANKEAPKTRILQGNTTVVDKFTDCEYNIAIFRNDRSYSFTGITCSQFDKLSKIDFAMESDGRDYIYFTKNYTAPPPPAPPAPPAPPKRILQVPAPSETVGANFLSSIIVEVTGPVKPEEVKFNFIGFNGEASPENQGLTLAQFQAGAPPSAPAESSGSFWTWFIIILVILLIVGGGLAGWYWYQNQQSSGSSASYKKSGQANASKDDLEDTRL